MTQFFLDDKLNKLEPLRLIFQSDLSKLPHHRLRKYGREFMQNTYYNDIMRFTQNTGQPQQVLDYLKNEILDGFISGQNKAHPQQQIAVRFSSNYIVSRRNMVYDLNSKFYDAKHVFAFDEYKWFQKNVIEPIFDNDPLKKYIICFHPQALHSDVLRNLTYHPERWDFHIDTMMSLWVKVRNAESPYLFHTAIDSNSRWWDVPLSKS